MKTELELLDPTEVVNIGTEVVQVRELRWVDALQFLQKLAAGIEQIAGTQAAGPDGTVRLNADRLRDAVLSGGELANTLLAKATSLPPARLESLSASQALVLLQAAVRVNFREELLGKLKAVGAAVQGTLVTTGTAR